jgi:hypothetical protein
MSSPSNDTYYDPYEYADDGWEEYAQEQYEQALIENAIKNISAETVKAYLGKYGDAIEERVIFCIKESKKLFTNRHFGASLTLSATAIELIIGFFLLRPLVQGAFLSDEWANILAKRIIGSRYSEYKKLLPAILENWSIEIIKEKISNQKNLWETIHNNVWPRRHKFAHQATTINKQEALIALECANALMGIVDRISNNLGFTRKTTGKWSHIENVNDKGLFESSQGFSTGTPFIE